MKRFIRLTAVLLALTIPAGCGSRIKKSDTKPTAEAIEVTSTPTAAPEAATPVIAETEQPGAANEPASAPEQNNAQRIPKATAEKLVLEATGATGLKLVAEGEAYVFDCYKGNDYMGTVEVNAKTGELTFQ